MKFPGKRKSKHYFPITETNRIALNHDFYTNHNIYVVGIDQLMVDIEGNVSEDFLLEYGLKKGQSQLLDEDVVESIYQRLKSEKALIGECPGGAVGNTLHNYSVLSDARSVMLGVISQKIAVGDYAFKYICSTHSLVDFTKLSAAKGAMGRALCLLTPDRERTFVIGPGVMNELYPDQVDESLVAKAAVLLISAYTLRDANSPIAQSTLKAMAVAKKAAVPIVFSLGTAALIEEKRAYFNEIISDYVNVVAGNEEEAKALTGLSDPLLALEKVLDQTDLMLLTVGPKGLYIGAWVNEDQKRETKDQLHSKSLPAYNAYEYSRAMLRKDSPKALKIYTHINPYMGGPMVIKNTNGAGDAALAALVHDLASNTYHAQVRPTSPKHNAPYLTYSSIHQVSKYCNRVSFEVLKQSSPRLLKGLPPKEESLEDAYWDT